MKPLAPLLVAVVPLLLYYFYPALVPPAHRQLPVVHTILQENRASPQSGFSLSNAPSSPQKSAPNSKQQEAAPLLSLVEATAEWLRGRENIFFNEDHFIGDLLLRDQQIISALGQRLRDLRPLLALSSQEEMVSTTPRVVRERMAMLDMISGILTSNEVQDSNKQALIAEMQAFIHQAIVNSYSAFAKKILITEKREALQRIAAHDPTQAREIWQQIPQEAVKTLLEE